MSRTLLAASLVALLAGLTAFAGASPTQAAPKPPPPLWLVTLDVGEKWDAAKMPQQQPGFASHVTMVNQLAADGTLLVGGPLLENLESHKVTGSIWVVKAPTEDAARKLATDDAFVRERAMKVVSVRAFFAAGGAWPAAAAAKDAPAAK